MPVLLPAATHVFGGSGHFPDGTDLDRTVGHRQLGQSLGQGDGLVEVRGLHHVEPAEGFRAIGKWSVRRLARKGRRPLALSSLDFREPPHATKVERTRRNVTNCGKSLAYTPASALLPSFVTSFFVFESASSGFDPRPAHHMPCIAPVDSQRFVVG